MSEDKLDWPFKNGEGQHSVEICFTILYTHLSLYKNVMTSALSAFK